VLGRKRTEFVSLDGDCRATRWAIVETDFVETRRLFAPQKADEGESSWFFNNRSILHGRPLPSERSAGQKQQREHCTGPYLCAGSNLHERTQRLHVFPRFPRSSGNNEPHVLALIVAIQSASRLFCWFKPVGQ
jgi:hypothetical protein